MAISTWVSMTPPHHHHHHLDHDDYNDLYDQDDHEVSLKSMGQGCLWMPEVPDFGGAVFLTNTICTGEKRES